MRKRVPVEGRDRVLRSRARAKIVVSAAMAMAGALLYPGAARPETGQRPLAGPGWTIPHEPAPCPFDAVWRRCVGPSISQDAIVRYRVNGILYEIPAIYHTRWPGAGEVATVQANDRGGLPDFAFWMPRRRPELIKTLPPMLVIEIGRQGGGWEPDEYPVTILQPRFISPENPGVTLPSQMLANERSVFPRSEETLAEEHGAERFSLHDDRFTLVQYRHRKFSNLEMVVACSVERPNPTCDGHFYYLDIELYFYMRFPHGRISHWQEMADTVRDLILGWCKPK